MLFTEIDVLVKKLVGIRINEFCKLFCFLMDQKMEGCHEEAQARYRVSCKEAFCS